MKENEASNELEISPQSYLLVRDLASRIVEDGGVVLIADYGHEGEKTDTFRVSIRVFTSNIFTIVCYHTVSLYNKGFKNHQLVEPLSDPGNCDLTADVNFAYLAAAAKEKDGN